MIVGVDTEGKVILSLSQSNSNGEMMKLFFVNLVRRLDEENSKWRNSTIILLDNASYHVSQQTLNVFEELRIPILFTGPHSYDGSAVELWFAAFKRADINPRKPPFGKK